mmetsp:Transcript_24562/g.32735  ORF Transcript_24562/g.32735 Transcript_24562/m.32735 type:complete len:100 (-) Transcript_24562:251-550(-)
MRRPVHVHHVRRGGIPTSFQPCNLLSDVVGHVFAVRKVTALHHHHRSVNPADLRGEGRSLGGSCGRMRFSAKHTADSDSAQGDGTAASSRARAGSGFLE